MRMPFGGAFGEAPRHEENTKTCIFLQFWTPGGAKTQENLVFYKATRENKQSHSRKQQATRENKQPTRENKDPAGHRDHNPAPPGRPATPGPRPKHSKTPGFRANDPNRRLQFNLAGPPRVHQGKSPKEERRNRTRPHQGTPQGPRETPKTANHDGTVGPSANHDGWHGFNDFSKTTSHFSKNCIDFAKNLRPGQKIESA